MFHICDSYQEIQRNPLKNCFSLEMQKHLKLVADLVTFSTESISTQLYCFVLFFYCLFFHFFPFEQLINKLQEKLFSNSNARLVLQAGISPEDCHDNQSSIHQSDDDFEIGDLPVKLELRYAIEAKRAEKGLDMPIIEEMPKLPREVRLLR